MIKIFEVDVYSIDAVSASDVLNKKVVAWQQSLTFKRQIVKTELTIHNYMRSNVDAHPHLRYMLIVHHVKQSKED